MADFRGDTPKITWDGNTLTFPSAPERPRDYSQPEMGSERKRFPSGALDSWRTGLLYVVEMEVRHIPLTDENQFGFTATGWQGATGWRAFLEHAWDGNSFDLFPDKDSATSETCRLIEPSENRRYELEDTTGLKRIGLKVYSTAGNAFDWY